MTCVSFRSFFLTFYVSNLFEHIPFTLFFWSPTPFIRLFGWFPQCIIGQVSIKFFLSWFISKWVFEKFLQLSISKRHSTLSFLYKFISTDLFLTLCLVRSIQILLSVRRVCIMQRNHKKPGLSNSPRCSVRICFGALCSLFL